MRFVVFYLLDIDYLILNTVFSLCCTSVAA